MSNQRLIIGFHAVNARLWQNPASIVELYVQDGRQDARMRDVLAKAAADLVVPLSRDLALGLEAGWVYAPQSGYDAPFASLALRW